MGTRSYRERAQYVAGILDAIEDVATATAPDSSSGPYLKDRVDNMVRLYCADIMEEAIEKLDLRTSE